MNWNPRTCKNSTTFSVNIIRLTSCKVTKFEQVLQLGVSERDSMVRDSGFSRQNLAISPVFLHFLHVFSLKHDCLKRPHFWQELWNFWLPSPDLVVAKLPTCSVNFSTMFSSLSTLLETVLVDIATKGTVVFMAISHNSVSILDFISFSKRSNLLLPLNC